MKVSRLWLQRFFEKPLPSVEELADALTFHAFEIESTDGDVLDVKVLPDRAGYALSHRGIASEVSAILNIPTKEDPLREPIPSWPKTDTLIVETDKDYVLRHTGALVKGVSVGPSPAWLVEILESVGQRSINNIVDASNFVMMNMGQPTHAFDADKIQWDGDTLKIDIRAAQENEKITILTGEEYVLSKNMYVIADGTSGAGLDIAGVKGGLASGVTNGTKNLFISAGNYDGTLIRRMSQNLKLFTDASLRFQNRPSPELTAYGMRDLLALIQEVAGGELVGVVDAYNTKPESRSISITAKKVSDVLGAPYSNADISDVLTRLDVPYTVQNDVYEITPPFERTDLDIGEDIVEEVGRIIGYDRVAPSALPKEKDMPFPDYRKRIEALRELLTAEGFNEISTYSLVEKGDVELAKPLAEDKKYLRTNLALGHQKAIALNEFNLPLFNASDVRTFELGHVWPKGEEKFVLGITYFVSGKGADKKRDAVFKELKEKLKTLLGAVSEGMVTGNTLEFDMNELLDVDLVPNLPPSTFHLQSFKMFSVYPFVLRDIAVWVPEKIHPVDVSSTIRANAGEYLLRCDLFDSFSKDGRTSYAFHLVFQSYDRTLSDGEAGKWMNAVTGVLTEKGWAVR